MRGQRSSAPGPASAQPAVARRSGRDGRVDGDAARSDPGRSRSRPDQRSRSCSAVPTTARRVTSSGLRAEPVDIRRCDARRRALGVRAERTAASSATRVPGATVGPGLVRHDERQVAPVDHRRRRAVRGLSDVGLPSPAGRGGRGHTRHADGAACADDPARLPGILHALEDARRRAGDAGGTRMVRVGERGPRRGERRRRGLLERRPAVGAGGRLRVAALDPELDRRGRNARASGPATDETGRVQPTEQPWNHHGLSNNLVQRISVVVRSSAAD